MASVILQNKETLKCGIFKYNFMCENIVCSCMFRSKKLLGSNRKILNLNLTS